MDHARHVLQRGQNRTLDQRHDFAERIIPALLSAPVGENEIPRCGIYLSRVSRLGDYAVTAHRSQGKSVDAVIISGDGMRKELFYVAASRGHQSVHVITSDKESLRESVARSSARKSASELARNAGRVLMGGAYRGIMAARHLAMRLSMREPESVPAEIYQHEFRREQRRERDFGR